MTLQELFSFVHDECGDQRREMLGTNRVALAVLSQLDLYAVKMAASNKGGYSTQIFTPTADSGALNLPFTPEIVRIKNLYSGWQIVDIVDDIESLTRDQNAGRLSILFLDNFQTYRLSCKPDGTAVFEVWGKGATANRPQFGAAISALPAEFHQLIAVKAALEVLDDLLLPNSAGKNFVAFVSARKASLAAKARELDFFFNVHRTVNTDSKSLTQIEPYNPFDGLGSSFSDCY